MKLGPDLEAGGLFDLLLRSRRHAVFSDRGGGGVRHYGGNELGGTFGRVNSMNRFLRVKLGGWRKRRNWPGGVDFEAAGNLRAKAYYVAMTLPRFVLIIFAQPRRDIYYDAHELVTRSGRGGNNSTYTRLPVECLSKCYIHVWQSASAS